MRRMRVTHVRLTIHVDKRLAGVGNEDVTSAGRLSLVSGRWGLRIDIANRQLRVILRASMVDYTRYTVPVLACFAESYKRHDARREARSDSANDGTTKVDDDDNVLSAAIEMRRRGLTEAEFRQTVVDSLTAIVNTVDLQSSEDIRDLEYVSRSILNYGIYDLTHLTSEDAGLPVIEQNITAALVNFEPRIRRNSVQVTRELIFNEVNQTLRLSIFAELSCKPMEIPVEFVAEVDMSVGKVSISSGLKRS